MIPSLEDILNRADKITPLLEPFEQRRKRAFAFIKYMLIFLVAFLIVHLSIIILFKQPFYHLLISSALAAIAASQKRFFTDKTLAIEFKDQLFKDLVPIMLPLPYMFEAERHVDFKYFQDSQLFLHFPSSFGGANAVKTVRKGTLATTFLYSEIEAYTGDAANEITVFDGMFYVFRAFGNHHPPIVILPNRLQKKLGIIGKKIRRHSMFRGAAAKLFDEAFENEFSVYCENTRYAQETITKELRKKLLDFQAETGADIYMSFVGQKIYIGLHNCSPIRFSMRKPCTDLSYISEMVTKFTFPIRLVSDMNQKLIPPKAPPSWDI